MTVNHPTYHRILVEESEGKRPVGRYKCRWEDNIKMDLNEIGCEDVNWIHVSQVTNDRLL
jgi:hypothetical protein